MAQASNRLRNQRKNKRNARKAVEMAKHFHREGVNTHITLLQVLAGLSGEVTIPLDDLLFVSNNLPRLGWKVDPIINAAGATTGVRVSLTREEAAKGTEVAETAL